MRPAMREAVRGIMVDQLHAALCFGRGSNGPVHDDAAQAGAAAANCVLKELRAAFPAEDWRLPASVVELAEIPATSDAPLERYQHPAGRPSAKRPPTWGVAANCSRSAVGPWFSCTGVLTTQR
jgi:hypothetical protein